MTAQRNARRGVVRAKLLHAVLATALAGCFAIPAIATAADPVRTVVIEGMAYQPPTITVRRNQRVVWVNRDPVPHTVTAAANAGKPAFDSGSIASGNSWAYVARTPGTLRLRLQLPPGHEGPLDRRVGRRPGMDARATLEPTVARVDTSAVDDGAALARRIAEGDRGAFEQLMRRYNRRLYRLARAVLRNDADAEDALQEAYIAAYRGIARFRGDAALSTWLSRLVLNECLGRRRREARRDNIIPISSAPHETDPDTMSSDDAETPDTVAMRSQMRSLIERKLDDLPADFRVVFVLRTVEEMTVEEVAQALAIPEATVRSRHFRARSLLRASLAQEIDLAERDLFEFGGAHCDRVVARVMARLAGES